jgi:hypothetical protein
MLSSLLFWRELRILLSEGTLSVERSLQILCDPQLVTRYSLLVTRNSPAQRFLLT